ncbi:uncharacterized protein [Physcomitrium patens]|uniref:Uncharacterized protein n=1 Tax=Physcomitrium patens TaxID=3218 RepID=A0A2K1K014_PHYPA|nr:uncharacterized protein LOC112287447 [Physcomitrium patens]PNR47116.1 hypothetical protein PHYPA_014236 [Physcomitrium patens]|eukprot:XP_024386195.1 uncharacterized protein LOC112287447 [Physcomitrella patens]
MTMKDYTAWYSRIKSLVFFLVVLGTGAVLGVVTTLNVVGYITNSESGFLSARFPTLPPQLDATSFVSTSNVLPTTPISADLSSAKTTNRPDLPEQHESSSEASQIQHPKTMEPNSTRADNVRLVNGSDVALEPGSASTNSTKTEDSETVSEEMDPWSVSIVVKKSTIARKSELEENPEDTIDVGGIDSKVTDAVINSTLVENESMGESSEVPPLIFESEIPLMSHPVDLSTLSDVYHDMSEEELLWRASAGFLRRPRPKFVIPKVAYLFLTRGPLPLSALWERYFHGYDGLYSIFIHAHPNYLPKFPPNSVFYRRNIPSKEVFWGKLSVFAAERRLLANALLDAANEIFVLLSETCVPIAPLRTAYKYYMDSEHSFVEAYVNLGKGGIGRYNRIKGRSKLNPEIRPSQWRKGSQWFEISRNLALMVVSDRKYYSKFENFLCKNDCVCYIDEHYLPTVLTILAPSKLANRTSHYIDFTRSTAHPHQWNKLDINERTLRKITTGQNCTFNGKLTTTCHMFARKFSPDTIEPLLKLAARSFSIPEVAIGN